MRLVRGVCAITLAALVTVASTASIAAEAPKNSERSEAELEQKLEAARKRLDTAAREVAELSMLLSDSVVPHVERFVRMGMNRAMLGVNVSARRDTEVGEGVQVVSVSPGGPAAEAGLKAGDVLIEVNGKALKPNGDSPRGKLMAVMREVKPGEKVAVTYRRDGKTLKTKLVARPLADHMFTMALPMRGPHGVTAVGRMPRFAFMRAEGVFGSAELVALTPKLGQYFGTEKGLLVVRAPDDSRLKLEDGDVIVDIDGRTPSSPAHALRILSSYQAGEKLKLNVLRAKKRMSFEVTIPDDPWEKRFEGARLIEGDVFMHGPRPGEPMAIPLPPPGIDAVPAIEAAPLPPPLPDDAV